MQCLRQYYVSKGFQAAKALCMGVDDRTGKGTWTEGSKVVRSARGGAEVMLKAVRAASVECGEAFGTVKR